MKRHILIFGCIFLLNSTVYAQDNSTAITDVIPEQTNNFKGDKEWVYFLKKVSIAVPLGPLLTDFFGVRGTTK